MADPADLAAKGCDYHERNRRCGQPVIFRMKVGGRDCGFCERHIDPGFWPPDLQDRLPGRIRRTLMRR